MELLTEELKKLLPPLYAQEHEKDPMVYIKFFTPASNWTWYATEGSQQDDDFLFFGYVIGFEREWGYFSLAEFPNSVGPSVPWVERDLYFEPARFSEVERRHNQTHGGG
jgi:hypothetical protein